MWIFWPCDFTEVIFGYMNVMPSFSCAAVLIVFIGSINNYLASKYIAHLRISVEFVVVWCYPLSGSF